MNRRLKRSLVPRALLLLSLSLIGFACGKNKDAGKATAANTPPPTAFISPGLPWASRSMRGHIGCGSCPGMFRRRPPPSRAADAARATSPHLLTQTGEERWNRVPTNCRPNVGGGRLGFGS